ncbi:HAD-IIA family hydrolase [Janibacter cremeus]|uniref:HAD superfamily hydrolase (TIGR01450 family) n=1 Tax=Janibacter cremeus TaxID=1285192 RepID=A0A852VU63_9MICO|nr:HAD superfamily hydrolase (TIGR01450 family) [Janibacter cremeus]
MTRLIDGFDALICDVDGVVVAGSSVVAHAVDVLNSLEIPVVFATNNASRTPMEVAATLRGHGVHASADHVLTSSLAAARELANMLSPGSAVMAVGGPGVADSLRSVGLQPRSPQDEGDVAAVVQGYGPQVTAADLGAAAVAIRSGARWVATNADLTLPTEQGPLPGNGSLVSAVQAAVEVDPVIVGKPSRAIYALAAELVGAQAARTMAVGDRLETDIAGATASGMPGVLVLTGVHGPADAAGASPQSRPLYVLEDLRGLERDYPVGSRNGDWFARGDAMARCGERLDVRGRGIDAVRAGLDAVWAAVDAGRITSQDARALMVSR